jgi:hypothetical protein
VSQLEISAVSTVACAKKMSARAQTEIAVIHRVAYITFEPAEPGYIGVVWLRTR